MTEIKIIGIIQLISGIMDMALTLTGKVHWIFSIFGIILICFGIFNILYGTIKLW